MVTSFYSGTFDPFTSQDAEIVVNELVGCNKKVIIGIELDSEKEPLFTVAQRIEMVKKSIQWYAKEYCEMFFDGSWQEDYDTIMQNFTVVSYHGLPVHEAKKRGAGYLLVPVLDIMNPEYDAKFELCEQIAKRSPVYSIRVSPMSTNMLPEKFEQYSRLCYKHHEYSALACYVTPPVHNMMMEDLLEKRYNDCCRQSGILWSDFCATMSTRAYHNLSHIAYMLDKYREYKDGADEKFDFLKEQTFEAAIFFHDYVADDEEKSFIASRLPESAKGLFMATRHFEPFGRERNKYEQLIHDLDLAIFCDLELYKQYVFSVREEYIHVEYSEYVKQRNKVLNQLKKVIETETLFTKEQKYNAMLNIRREQKTLEEKAWKTAEIMK